MADGKRYYWLKLKDDFFNSKRIKKLRKMAGGDTYVIIYLKLQLMAMKTEGILTWTGLEDNFAAELALDLDENQQDVEMTLLYLLNTGLAETQDQTHFFFPYSVENTGSEGASAQRWRDWKARQALVSNTELTERKQITNGEIETDIETDTDIEKREEHAHKYGEFGWVKLTDKQYEKLLQDLGEKELRRCIRYVDESAQSTQNKNGWKDWNLTIRKCSRDRWGLDRKEQKPKQFTTAENYQAPEQIDAAQLEKIKAVFKNFTNERKEE